MQYHFTGSINASLILFSVIGLLSQVHKVIRRRRAVSRGEDAAQSSTDALSVNQFSTMFAAYLAFFIYGFSVSPFSHYLVWPRLLAAVVVLYILLLIWQDRRSRASYLAVGLASLSLCIAVMSLGAISTGLANADEGQVISATMMVVIAILLLQGYGHQAWTIFKRKDAGALDPFMNLFILIMDISTIALALTFGLGQGWPLICLATSSALTKIVMLILIGRYNGYPAILTRAMGRRS